MLLKNVSGRKLLAVSSSDPGVGGIVSRTEAKIEARRSL